MEYRNDDIPLDHDPDEKQVYLNIGTMRLVFVVDSREQNRELLSSLFEHMGKWFTENVEHLADAPELEGSSWRLHEEVIERTQDTPTELPEIGEIGDTFPEEWSQ